MHTSIKSLGQNIKIGSFHKTSIPPPQRKLEVNPPTPFGCPNTFTIIRNNFFSPPPPDGRNFLFLSGWSVDLFWNDPIIVYKIVTILVHKDGHHQQDHEII
jgi:hypothetical protein